MWRWRSCRRPLLIGGRHRSGRVDEFPLSHALGDPNRLIHRRSVDSLALPARPSNLDRIYPGRFTQPEMLFSRHTPEARPVRHFANLLPSAFKQSDPRPIAIAITLNAA